MLSLAYSQILFLFTLFLVLFLPGYSLLLSIFGNARSLSYLERFILSFGLSLISLDFLFFLYPRLSLPINRSSSLFGLLLFSLVCFLIAKLKKSFSVKNDEESQEDSLFHFSQLQFLAIIFLFFLIFFIKTAFLSEASLPTATDMGHHMYWSKWISENQKLPDYEGMPDFIIGEHIIFSVINLLSGRSYFSAFPLMTLYLFNLLSLLTVFVLALRIFKQKNLALFLLFISGVLFAVSSPQAKFVSGGVVGNILGNFLMPLTFYFFFRFSELIFEENKKSLAKKFLGLAIFSVFGLFYTHHLTAFIFIFVFSATGLIFLLANFYKIKPLLIRSFEIFVSPPVFAVFLVGTFFFLFILTPTYFSGSAVDTAVGTPTKVTRVGLDLNNLKSTLGEPRLALGLVGLLVLILFFRRENFGYALILSWSCVLYLMVTYPRFLFIDLPSSRLGNYLTYPFSFLSAFALFQVFQESKNFFSKKILKFGLVLILIFTLSEGISDSTNSFKLENSSEALIQVFNASAFTAQNIQKNDTVLKDHNYLTGDTWIKLYFMQGYKYPLSRSYFKRYEDESSPREMCTLYMISNPGSSEAKKCFSETQVNFILVNPQYDSGQFHRLNNFNQVYSAPEVAVFYKK